MRPKSALVLQGILRKETPAPQSTGSASSISLLSPVAILILSYVLRRCT